MYRKFVSRFEMVIKGDNRLSPEERYLVLALYIEVVLYQNEIVNVKVSTLVSDFGATTKVVKNVVEYLVKKKNIKLINLPTKARQLIFSQDDIANLSEEWATFPSWKQDSILGLFEPEKRKILIPKKVEGSSSKGGLRNSNLLLMFIFIFHSNDVGLVKDLSHKSIRFMMGGISEDRLKSQLKTLNKVKYILVNSRGGTGRKLFGKVSSNYILNIGKLQGKGKIVEKELEIESNSMLYDVKLMTRDIQQVIPFIKKLKDGELKNLLILFGDDVDRYMDIMRLVINKCECLISIILKRYWSELDDLTVADCQFLDDPRMKTFLTARSLFSMKYIYDVREPKDKEEKTQCLEEVLVTNDSFNKFCLGGEVNDELVIEAHYLIELLLTHSIAIAVKVKNLLISHLKYENNEIKNIAIGFGTIVMNGISRNSYDLVVSLRDTEGYRIYSILALVSKKEARKYDCRINLTTWKYT